MQSTAPVLGNPVGPPCVKGQEEDYAWEDDVMVDEYTGPARGRVIKMRLGINPNSSGHGILWGAMFFLPMSALGAILASTIERRLARSLRQHKENDGHGR
ncbi:MAG: hypothetical protein AB1445_08505 [Bacillota bacterium]